MILRLPYRRSRRRFLNPWAGPINAILKCLKLPTVTPGGTLSAFLFLCRFSDAFSPPLTHATINLQPSLHNVLYQTLGSSAAVLQFPVMPNIRRPSATQYVYYFSSPLRPRCPGFSSSPGMTCGHHAEQLPRQQQPLRAHGCFDNSHSVRWRASL